ncbi:MAG: CBS domain-containing protein [Acidobacteriota bacterium]
MQSTVDTILTEAVIDIDQPVRAALLEKGSTVHSITADQSVHGAISKMSEHYIGCLVVLDPEQKLVGMITERDYCRKVILMGRSSRGTRVREIMSESVSTVSPDHTVREAMALMTEQRIRHMPVVEDGAVVGLLSIGDVVKWVLGEQRQAIRDLRYQIANHEA